MAKFGTIVGPILGQGIGLRGVGAPRPKGSTKVTGSPSTKSKGLKGFKAQKVK